MRLAGIGYQQGGDQMHEAETHFDEIARGVQQEIADAESLANTAVQNARNDANRAEFREILDGLDKVGAEHKKFDEHAGEIIALANC